MTIPVDSQNFESYVPVYDVAPDEWEEGRGFLVEQLKKYGEALNVRTIGFYLDQELLTGNSFIPGVNIVSEGGSSQQFRSVLRKVINFGTLPNSTTKSVPHGITFDANFTLVSLITCATDPVSLIAIPIPFTDTASTTNQIVITMDATNINITAGTNRSNFTTCYVIIEYMQEL